MFRSLSELKAETLQHCKDASRESCRRLLFGMVTSLMLYKVPLPESVAAMADRLHTVSKEHARRPRSTRAGIDAHVWKHFDAGDVRRAAPNVLVLDPVHAWAQLSPHVTLMDLVIVGDGVVTALAKATKTDPGQVLDRMKATVTSFSKFHGKRRCLQALRLMRPGVLSPMETVLRLRLAAHGLPECAINAVIGGMSFGSGAEMTLDIAWLKFKVGVEYDGDHHRTDRRQWRLDREKRGVMQAHDWMVFTATAANLRDEHATAEFVFRVARCLAMRGAEFKFRLIASTLEELAGPVR
ncbi:hypothetical protein F7D09_2082 [Bifidobacterium leontopitheci]|uniref:DUF559 domain-containing protein n=2 Tax=Bifidobacterium leontopitheci TaxID=2650774 RepID=A0A6I1GBL7_9BIFI|nr:hypothetical protein F7D09_2082 [Bifidobacterium leontopitheci]